ncbi:Dimer Tnp hAT domain-containing protein [Aphis craccivora]|uniref:Dimer Tnp hAT domain-containing protein n=1 Tax=Aphis craccivora TaxID=307492 RepID=A0A6G0Z5L0_APHCR|nr:Dimer Tnp hAT domain-containing protein [Aphis craccivora]
MVLNLKSHMISYIWTDEHPFRSNENKHHPNDFSKIKELSMLIFILFGSIYICEQTFFHLNYAKFLERSHSGEADWFSMIYQD